MPRTSGFRIELSAEERAELERRAKTPTLTWREVQRARIVLYAADRMQDIDIAARLDCSVDCVVGESVSEVDLEGGWGWCSVAGGPPFRFGSLDGEVDELGGGLFVWEVAAGLDRLADLAVHGFDCVGNRYERR